MNIILLSFCRRVCANRTDQCDGFSGERLRHARSADRCCWRIESSGHSNLESLQGGFDSSLLRSQSFLYFFSNFLYWLHFTALQTLIFIIPHFEGNITIQKMSIEKLSETQQLLHVEIEWTISSAESDSCESCELLWRVHSEWEHGDFLVPFL